MGSLGKLEGTERQAGERGIALLHAVLRLLAGPQWGRMDTHLPFFTFGLESKPEHSKMENMSLPHRILNQCKWKNLRRNEVTVSVQGLEC